MRVTDRIRTGPATLARSRAAAGHYGHVEPARRIELRLPPYQGGVLTVITKQAWLAAQASNLESVLIQSQAGLPVPPAAIRSHLPDSNRQPSAYKAAALPLRQGGI